MTTMDGGLLRVERGDPDPVELAALVAVLTASGGSPGSAVPTTSRPPARQWTGRPGTGAAWSAGATTVGRLRG